MFYFSNLEKLFFGQKTNCLLLLILSVISSQVYAHNTEKKSVVTYQYAIFYVETEGEFVVPVGVDAPAIYSWTEPGKSIKGDIPEIWLHLGIPSEVEYSFAEIENKVLNHVATNGWLLHDIAITSVPLPMNAANFRTAYRYIFKRSH